MDVRIINPFLAGAVRVLTTMAMMEPVPGKPFITALEAPFATL